MWNERFPDLSSYVQSPFKSAGSKDIAEATAAVSGAKGLVAAIAEIISV